MSVPLFDKVSSYLNNLNLSNDNSLKLSFWKIEINKILKSKQNTLWNISKLDYNSLDYNSFCIPFSNIIQSISKDLLLYKNNSISLGFGEYYCKYIQTEFYSNSPNSFQQSLYSYFNFHFKYASNIYCKDIFTEDDEEEEDEEDEEDNDISMDDIPLYEKNLHDTCLELNNLYLLELCTPIITQVCCNQIRELINTKCCSAGFFESGRLSQVLSWLNEFIYKWIKDILSPISLKSSFNSLFCSLCTRLEFFLYESFANLRISELFDIIIDFPDSKPALEDLKICLIKTNQLNHLIHSLSNSFKKRLLHPGANTTDIIIQFMNTIKALQVLDPTILSMDILNQPIRKYLQNRDDTVKCIVNMFTNETSELYQELTEINNSLITNENNDWNPLPIHSLITSNSIPPKDIFTHLIHIFGSKELFVNEYRNMLAERLINAVDFNIDKEMHNMELLKIRFGEAVLNYCDIMVKDIAFSKRMNKLICDKRDDLNQYQAIIISHLFWPSFKDESINLPSEIIELSKKFHEGYRNIKRDRIIEWKTNLGLVELDIELHGELKSLLVTPVQATIIYHFEKQSTWNIDELSTIIGISNDSLKRKIIFWINQGVLQSTEPGIYTLREQGDINMEDTLDQEEDTESTLTSTEDELAGMWALCFNFINACLSNHGEMSVDKIHFMLSSLMREEYKATQQELKIFLESKVKQDLLEKENNLYKSKE